MFGKIKEKELKERTSYYEYKEKAVKKKKVLLLVGCILLLIIAIIAAIISIFYVDSSKVILRIFAIFVFTFSIAVFLWINSKYEAAEEELNRFYSSINLYDSWNKIFENTVPNVKVPLNFATRRNPPQIIDPDTKNTSYNGNSTDDTIIKMMLGNLTEISEYYRLSKRQAGWAFWSAIVSFFAGFVFLGVVIWILLNKSTDTLALIIPAIGTVVSELFGLTIFSVYKKSLNQLNSYYDSLHDNERFISLLYITDKLSDPKQRDELFTQIVKDQISTINRQKTKAEEQNAKKPSGKKVVLVKKNKKNNSKNP